MGVGNHGGPDEPGRTQAAGCWRGEEAGRRGQSAGSERVQASRGLTATHATTLAAPTPAPTPAPARMTGGFTTQRPTRSIGFTVTGVVLVLLALVLMLKMGAQQRGGPAHQDISIGNGIPATIFLPVDAAKSGDFPDPAPKGKRPPVIVIAHGYSADRASMSGMARSFARAGYAVVTFDFRGHGGNTHPFQGDLTVDVKAVVDWARTSPFVDSSRLAVLGHSMGASAVLEFATKDPRPVAVVPVSGGFLLNDAVVPAHTLLIDASGDPGRIRDRQKELRDELSARGGAVVHKEVGGTNHLTILRSSEAIGDIAAFLDPIMGIERPAGTKVGLDDPRMRTAGLYLIVALGLIAVVGSLAGRLVPDGPTDEAEAPVWGGFALVAGALLLTLPVLAVGPIDPLPLGAGLPVVVHLALASALLWGCRALAQRGQLAGAAARWTSERVWLPLREVGWAGLAASGAVVLLLLPMSGVFHRLVPTPERAVYWVVATLLALPFFAAFEALLRRGRPGVAAGWGVLGRLVLLVVLLLGLGMHALPSVIALVLPLLVLQYAILEIFAAGAYARARNTAVIAVVDATITGWIAVMLTPIG
jgi:dienelactone hydrolase